MRRSLEFLESLPPYEPEELLPAPWPDLCAQVYGNAKADILDLLDDLRKVGFDCEAVGFLCVHD